MIANERSDAEQGAVLPRRLEENVSPALDDVLIAAIAESAEMTIATRNTKHFELLGVPCLNPWDTTGARH